MIQTTLKQLINNHELPNHFIDTVNQWYMPIASDIASLRSQSRHNATSPPPTLIIGIQGSQGSGKSTFASFLQHILQKQHQLSTVTLSIDDFYLRRSERETLARQVHPLLITRGVPGTHDVTLARNTLQQLRTQKAGDSTRIVRFNKAIDDRAQPDEWDEIHGHVDIIIFEGWCIGAPPQEHSALDLPVNTLEQEEDDHSIWRHYVNRALTNEYQDLFSLIDKLAILSAPSFECVYEWRWLQEQKLAQQWQHTHPTKPTRLLDQKDIVRFISHYQRLSQHCLHTLPHVCDWELLLNPHHAITALKQKHTPKETL
jgi:D-glycerate 3-kinase